MRHLGPLCSLLLASVLAACATPQASKILAEGGRLPRQAEVAAVPFYPQKLYYCGPAALAMVLTWSGEPVTQDAMVPEVYTPSRQGTLRNDMVAAARRRGRLAVQVGDVESLLAEIAAGNPVVVFQNLALDWFPQWHYAVAVAYDLDQGEIVLRSGTDARLAIHLYAFERTWKRGDYWGLVVLPPERLPATGDERSVLDAAAGLERTGRLREAASAYTALLSRWPESFPAWMGLGNTLYARKDFSAAVPAFREAIRRRPQAPAAWNNLAYALAAQGKHTEALRAAEEAVRLAPESAHTYRDTLREISGSTP
jgi:tetratricopeptide (TPR) repeat protein